ncbi:hypothetical protein O9A_00828 [Bartonella koehlerae C-29]|uniref:Uncharacterized protein n=1 Tax=Bartonella koehlerae C-29 TaxID=1134510 RepID=A0A067WFI6_9HYPH|nr:hypothetical protein O9A_00828 [Bartonella koehlerae C-29]
MFADFLSPERGKVINTALFPNSSIAVGYGVALTALRRSK